MAQPRKPLPSPATAAPTGEALDSLEKLSALTQVDFELEFFSSILGRHPEFVEALRVQASNLATKGRIAEGLDIDRQIIRIKPTDPLSHYNLACSYALLKQPELAITTLRKAIELGYRDFQYIKADKDLASIHRDPRFEKLLRQYDKQ